MTMQQLIADWQCNPTAATRRHQQQGGRVIGYAGPEIPVELILAAGAIPLRIPEQPMLGTDLADQYLEQSFSPASRTLVEQYLQGHLDYLDALILPRSNDSLQRVYYYLTELQRRGSCRGPRVLIYDLAKIERASSERHALQATHQLAIALRCDLDRLPAAIAARNLRRRLLANAKAQRASGRSAAELQLIAQLADACVPGEFDVALGQWLQQALPSPLKTVPVLLAGSAPPDERLHQAIESAGGNVIAELGEQAANLLDTRMVVENGGLAAVSAHYRGYAAGSRSFAARADLLQQLLQQHAPAVVIHWLIEQDEGLVWDLPGELSIAKQHHLPTLTLTRRQWLANDGVLQDITRFVADHRSAA